MGDATGAWTPEQVKEFVSAVMDERESALRVASDEREKAASALRGEQQRALDQAERERVKAADNLRLELARATEEGDERLREHISNQVQQIREAIISAEKLEMARIERVAADVASLSEKMDLVRETTELAQDKFEATVQRDSVKQNEFRESLSDLSKLMATRRETESGFASMDGKIEELSKQIGGLRSRLDTGPEGLRLLQSKSDYGSGQQQGSASTWSSVNTLVLLGIGVGGLVLAAVAYFAGSQ